MSASFNIVSLRRHIHELEIILREYNIEILTLNETRLEPLIGDNEFDIPGYEICRNDRIKNGGGVAVYVKDELPEPKVNSRITILNFFA